jgi:hypothetical protein
MLGVQTIETLRGHAGEHCDGEQYQQDGAGADESDAAARRGAHLLEGGATLTQGGAKVALRHHEEKRRAEGDGQDAAEQER